MLVAGLFASNLLLAGGLTANMAPSETLDLRAMANFGTGLSLAGTGKTTLVHRSPVFLNLAASASFDQLNWLEFEAGTQLEIEQRVGVALVPRIRARIPSTKRLKFNVAAAFVAFVYPYSLAGIQGSVGTRFAVAPHVSITVDAYATAFVGGSDLIADTGLMKLDLAFGALVAF